ncbi:hypothetical protein D3C78_1636820 [compost metagenome]
MRRHHRNSEADDRCDQKHNKCKCKNKDISLQAVIAMNDKAGKRRASQTSGVEHNHINRQKPDAVRFRRNIVLNDQVACPIQPC